MTRVSGNRLLRARHSPLTAGAACSPIMASVRPASIETVESESRSRRATCCATAPASLPRLRSTVSAWRRASGSGSFRRATTAGRTALPIRARTVADCFRTRSCTDVRSAARTGIASLPPSTSWARASRLTLRSSEFRHFDQYAEFRSRKVAGSSTRPSRVPFGRTVGDHRPAIASARMPSRSLEARRERMDCPP